MAFSLGEQRVQLFVGEVGEEEVVHEAVDDEGDVFAAHLLVDFREVLEVAGLCLFEHFAELLLLLVFARLGGVASLEAVVVRLCRPLLGRELGRRGEFSGLFLLLFFGSEVFRFSEASLFLLRSLLQVELSLLLLLFESLTSLSLDFFETLCVLLLLLLLQLAAGWLRLLRGVGVFERCSGLVFFLALLGAVRLQTRVAAAWVCGG